MALSIYTNVSSLNAQRSLMKNTQSLGKSLQRLSSGLRINSASDDAAGLAISTGLQAQNRGLNQAIRNASDGLSLLGTAEAAMDEQVALLQRMRELAVQAASDTNSGSNRAALNDEVQQLKDEFDRLAKTVQFNGINLIDGSFTDKDIQVGAYSGVDQRISVDIANNRAAEVGKSYTATGSTGVSATALTTGTVKITVDGTQYEVGAAKSDGVSFATSSASAIAVANAINEISGATGVVAKAKANTVDATGNFAAGAMADGDLKINGVSIKGGNFANIGEVVSAINNVSAATGVVASDNGGKIQLVAEDGRNVTVEANEAASDVTGFDEATTTTRAAVELVSYKSGFSVTDSGGNGLNGLIAGQSTDSVATLKVSDKASAKAAIDTIDGALEQVNTRRAAIGAQVNRLTSVVSNLSAVAENVAASNSRIMDADFASETANLTRTQILQQAATAVLAQANQAPQLALSLLR